MATTNIKLKADCLAAWRAQQKIPKPKSLLSENETINIHVKPYPKEVYHG